MTTYKKEINHSFLGQELIWGIVTAALILVVWVSFNRFGALGAFGVLISLGCLVFMMLRPEMTSIGVIFILYSNLAVVAVRFHGIPEILGASFFLLLGLPLINYVIFQRQRFIFNEIFLLMLAYLLVILLSAVFSGDTMESLERIVIYCSEGIILYFLIINTIRSRAILRKAVWTLIAAGAFMGSISLYQEITGTYDNALGGLAQVKDSEISTGETTSTGKDIKRRRLSGPIGSKNRYAQIMVVLLPLALFRFLGESSLKLRILAGASCVPILSGALLTFSRGAGVSIGLVLLIMMFMRYIKVRHFIVFSALFIGVVLVAVPHYVHRGYKIYESISSVLDYRISETDAAVRGRLTVNLAALDMFLDRPILGVGPGQTAHYMTKYAADKGFRRITTQRRAHNMYIEELADTGILGFAILMAIILITLLRLVKVRRICFESHPDLANIATGFLLVIAGYLSTAIFLHLSYIRYFWLLLALGGATYQIYRSEISQGREMESSDEIVI